MKTILSSVFVICLLSAGAFAVENASEEPVGKLEISVDYERQAGRGSNQYAVWIEDAEGNLVKTLYVTRFTAEGGYEPRPACTPTWVKKANPAALDKAAVDAFSGATPQTGKQLYSWNGTDNSGKTVAPGKYAFVVEATYWDKNSVVFKGEFTTDREEAVITTTPDFNSDEEKNRTMVKEVTARYLP